jgi:hypothetical protein
VLTDNSECASLREYQAYVISQDGRIENRLDLQCEDDEVAMERASILAPGHAIELWQNDRKVANLPSSL